MSDKKLAAILFFEKKDSKDEVSTIIRNAIPTIYSINVANPDFNLLLGKEHKKLLFLYALEDVELAYRYYLAWQDNEYFIRLSESPHYNFLICRVSQAERAYKLCQKGAFLRLQYDASHLR